jgi:hypothetical protein
VATLAAVLDRMLSHPRVRIEVMLAGDARADSDKPIWSTPVS